MFENHNQLFSFQGLGIICISMLLHLGQIKFVFFKHISATHELQTKMISIWFFLCSNYLAIK